jgi:hypothetical protein
VEQATHHANGHIRELNDEQAWELFDKAARYYLEISGDAFLERWDSGYYEDPDQPEVMSVVMLLPFVRSE